MRNTLLNYQTGAQKYELLYEKLKIESTCGPFLLLLSIIWRIDAQI